MKEGYYYAIMDGEEKIVEKRKGLKYPYLSGFCCEREYILLGRVPNFAQGNILNKLKIRRCCANCANFVKYSNIFDEEIEYWCDLPWDELKDTDRSELDCGLDENKCKYFEINAEKLKDAFECDEVEAKDE